MTNDPDPEFALDCPVTWSIVDSSYNTLLNWQKYAIYLDANNGGRVTIDNAYYEGQNINFYVKAWTGFNDPVYRLIAITEDVTPGAKNCMQQTLTPNLLFPYEFKGIKNYAVDDPVTSVDLL